MASSGIVGRDVRVVEVGLAELIIGNHDNGTEAPLPSRNDGVYMRSGYDKRIGIVDSVDEGRRSLSFCSVAPDGNSSRVHVRRYSAVRRGRQAPAGSSEREASCMRKGEGNSAGEGFGFATLRHLGYCSTNGVLPRDGTHALSPCGSKHPS